MATKTLRNCEECGKPGASGRYLKLGDDRIYAVVDGECKAAIEARHAEWLASDEGRAAVAEYASYSA